MNEIENTQEARSCAARLLAIREAAFERRKLLLELAEENREGHDRLTARANALGDLYEVLGAGERGMANEKSEQPERSAPDA